MTKKNDRQHSTVFPHRFPKPLDPWRALVRIFLSLAFESIDQMSLKTNYRGSFSVDRT